MGRRRGRQRALSANIPQDPGDELNEMLRMACVIGGGDAQLEARRTVRYIVEERHHR